MAWNELTNLTLGNSKVRLRRITVADRQAFGPIACDPDIWRHFVFRIASPSDLDLFLEEAIRDSLSGTRIVFAIIERDGGRVVGSTAYGNLSARERKLEIGWSWLSADVRGTGINRAAKLALLDHAFGPLQCERVEFKTDVLNTVARAGLASLGATEEGVLRSFNYMPDGRRRDVVYYSILRDEWPALRKERFGSLIS
jgi:RimJ/RimL family protein N-acetyltransferase